MPENEHAPLADDSIGDLLNPPVVLVQALVALEKMRQREAQAGGRFGQPFTNGPFEGVQNVRGGFRRHYSNGTLYMKGAQGTPFFLDLAMAHQYDLVGNTSSFLGFPLSDTEVDPGDASNARAVFEGGFIYTIAGLGTRPVGAIQIRYVGFHCFGETDESSANDEPYFIIGVVPLNGGAATGMTQIYKDVNAGDSRTDGAMEVFFGGPEGVGFTVSLFEHDHGDPNRFKEQVANAVDLAAEKTAALVAETIPVVGLFLAAAIEIANVIFGPELVQELNGLLGTEDDAVGSVTVNLTTRDLVRLSGQPPSDFHGVAAHVETPLIEGDGSSYKAYFEVLPASF